MELTNRLERVLSLVREGAVIYDIGSDHGYLPLELVKRGVCPRAVVTDVNRGPLERGKLTFEEGGATEAAEFYLTDGLQGLTFGDEPSDVTICGMGGELIATILDARRDIWGKDINFVLQPMTKSEHLRAFLWASGFETVKECAVCEGDKSYIIINARHKGGKISYSEVEMHLGKMETLEKSAEMNVIFEKTVSAFEKKLTGRSAAGHDVSALEAFIKELKNEAEKRKSK